MSDHGSTRSVTGQVIGTGTTVFSQPEPVTGPVVFLDSPDEVMDFVEDGDPTSIVISRGGATTFMAPVLVTGVRGLITLQGSPESHLGILSREYGIPCVMSVTFTEGIQTSRGETIPPNGALVTLDVCSLSKGRVLRGEDGDK